MAIQITTMRNLREYIAGVMERTEHSICDKVIAPLLIEILLHADPDRWEVKQYDGVPANIAWVYINNKRYAFCYNHNNGKIELRDRTYKGKVIYKFDNSNVEDVKKIISELASDKAA